MLVAARLTGATTLACIGAIHANWATGSAWPARDRLALSQAVIGSDRLPGPGPSIAVAGLLAMAAAFVAGFPRDAQIIRRTGAAGAAFVLLARGVVGLAGLMPHDRRSEVFATLNRRAYSPLCLALATIAAYSAWSPLDGRP